MIDSKNWKEETIIAFDLETTGKYPLGAEICEMAAVKWKGGEVVDTFQTLIKPTALMSQEVINIHGISNSMVEGAPQISEKIEEFWNFVQDGYLVAHHAPFDMGFLAIEFERKKLKFPERTVLCSSLLSRRAIPESPNNKLQTLVSFLKFPEAQAHRALDDAKQGLRLTVECFKRIGEVKSMSDIVKYQKVKLAWSDYSILALKSQPSYRALVEAAESKQPVQIVYQGGSRKGQARTVHPEGIVRTYKGDFLVAKDDLSAVVPKRYFFNKITNSSL